MERFDNKNIIFISNDNKCPFDNEELLVEENNLLNESFNNYKWEKELLQVCPKCGSYCIDKNVSHTFKLKYNQYTFNEVNDRVPVYNQSIIYIPRETFGIKHIVCNGKLKTYCKTEQKEFYVLDLDRGYVKIKLDYCPDCGKYFDMSGSYIKRRFKNISVLKEEFVEVTIEKKEEPPKIKKDKIKITKKPQVHELNDKDRIEDQKKFIKRHERHIIDNTKVIIDGNKEKEEKADKFALNTMIDEESWIEILKSDLKEVTLKNISEKYCIPMSFIVGRLAKNNKIKYDSKIYQKYYKI